MEQRLRVSEEHGCIERDSDSPVLQVEYRHFEPTNKEELFAVLPLFWEYWFRVNGEDLGEHLECDVLGVPIRVHQAEAKLYEQLASGSAFQLVYEGDDLIGFMQYHVAYSCVLIIRAMYFDSKHQKSTLGKDLVNSLELPIKEVIFQTRVNAPPERMLEIAERYGKVLHEEDKLKTWSMLWADRPVRQ